MGTCECAVGGSTAMRYNQVHLRDLRQNSRLERELFFLWWTSKPGSANKLHYKTKHGKVRVDVQCLLHKKWTRMISLCSCYVPIIERAGPQWDKFTQKNRSTKVLSMTLGNVRTCVKGITKTLLIHSAKIHNSKNFCSSLNALCSSRNKLLSITF